MYLTTRNVQMNTVEEKKLLMGRICTSDATPPLDAVKEYREAFKRLRFDV